MKRAIAGILILLTLGLCTSIAIAWIGTLFRPGDELYRARLRLPASNVVAVLEVRRFVTSACVHQFNSKRREMEYWSSRGAAGTTPEYDAPYWSSALDCKTPPLCEYAAGWPMRCLLRIERVRPGLPDHEWNTETLGTLNGRFPWIKKTRSNMLQRRLPIRPIALGLAINSILCAGAWFLIILAWLKASRFRAARRFKRRRCTRCGHVVAGAVSPCCTECGAEIGWRPPLFSRARLTLSAITALLFIALLSGFAATLATAEPVAPLHMAVGRHDIDAIDALLARGADIDQQVWMRLDDDYWGSIYTFHYYSDRECTPIECAVLNGDVDLAELLIDAGASVGGRTGDQLAHDACRTRQPDMVRLLARHGVDFNRMEYKSGVIESIARDHDIPMLFALKKVGFDFSDSDWPLGEMISLNEFEMADTLVELGAPITARVVERAVETGEVEVFKHYNSQFGAINDEAEWFRSLVRFIPNKPGVEPLWDHLLNAGADLEAPDSLQATTIFYAAGRNTHALNMLLERGVDVHVVDTWGETALFVAARADAERVTMLLNAGADPTIISNQGDSVLDYARDDDIRAILEAAIEQWNDEHGDDAPPSP
jgi:ankyrin repeat protein